MMRTGILAPILVGSSLVACSSPAEQRQAAYQRADAAIAALKTEQGRANFYTHCMKNNAGKTVSAFFEGVPPDKTNEEYCRRLVIVFSDGYLSRDQIANALDPSVSDDRSNAEITAAMHKLDAQP
jgi:hypothetical protein